MTARTTEPVIEIQMSEGGVEIVPPHQHHDAAAEPNAFWIAGRTVDGLRGFRELIGLALVVLLGGVGRVGG